MLHKKEANFVHLHLHTEYSLLDGAIRIHALPERLKKLGMSACAITDHGAMYGVLDFYRAMKENGLKPIIGCECYIAPRGRFQKEGQRDREPYHIVLLAKDNEGLKNLNRLVSAGHVEGFYYRPRIDHELLASHAKGLIALSACLSGELAQLVLDGDTERAKIRALWYEKTFGHDNFYLEIQANATSDQARVNQALVRLSNETGIPLVATNDCHYLMEGEDKAHDILLCMQTGKKVADKDRMRMPTGDFFVKSEEQMRKMFEKIPSAIENTVKIASMCQAEYTFGQIHLPSFDLPAGYTSNRTYLRELAQNGLHTRLETNYANDLSDALRDTYTKRLDEELEVIDEMGFSDYYLIVWDFIHYARQQQIMVGPGRGSGAGSLVAYALAITNIDPIRYGLIFERFLNRERVGMPDFDIDFCYERREEVIRYVTKKYGKDKVAQVITFGTLAARACVRDVARALDMPYAQSDKLAKMIPFAIGMTIEQALTKAPELKDSYDNDAEVKRVLDTAMLFEGMPRHASTHAAGVVIASCPLTDIAPLAKNDESIMVQFDKNKVEAIGLLKFDFLGLRTLTVLRDTADMIQQNTGETIDYDRIPIDDAAVYEMIGNGETDGVFQLESSGMTDFMSQLRPTCFEDIIAGISLYRPGPMDQIPQYIKARHDADQIRYAHVLLKPILEVTYGCIIYQEQVMQIVRDLAGFSMGQADNIRRAMSKKKASLMEKYRTLFIHGGKDEMGRTVEGAINRGVPEHIAKKIFEDVSHFAGYAFNKSHAAAYAVVGYQTAYMRHYYPTEFMAAMLNSYRGNLAQAAKYIGCCKKMGLFVLPPDINLSQNRFATEGEGRIRIGLCVIKNVGEAAVEALVLEREKNGLFKSYGHCLQRAFDINMHKKTIESLILAGALDTFGVARAQMVAALEPYYQKLQSAKKNKMEGQLSFFSIPGLEEDLKMAEPDYLAIDEYPMAQKLAYEKEMVGIYISGHPLDAYKKAIDERTDTDSSAFAVLKDDDENLHERELKDRERVKVAGLLSHRTSKTTKNNELMAFVKMEDLLGSFEIIVFPNVLRDYGQLLQENRVLLCEGRVSIREEEAPKLIAESFKELEKKSDKKAEDGLLYDNHASPDNVIIPPSEPSSQRLLLRFSDAPTGAAYQRLLSMLSYFSGTTPVSLYLEKESRSLDLPQTYQVEASDEVLFELKVLLGEDNVVMV